MAANTLKPRENEVRDVLKELKEGFDDPSLDFFEPTLLRQAVFSDEPRFEAWRPEIYHQLAARAERRCDYDEAGRRYRLSRRFFIDNSLLGMARETRDYGMMLCYVDDPAHGLKLMHEALEFHQEDLAGAKGKSLAKGERQARVTQGYVWRARVLADDGAEEALDRLVALALEDGRDFCLRDQHFVITFARRYVGVETRRLLDMRHVEVCAQRGNMTGTVTSIAHVGIGTGRLIAGRLVKSALRKE